MPSKAIVIDANILVRAVLGQRVRRLLVTYCESVSFYLPQTALAEAEEHLPTLAARRGGGAVEAVKLLRAMADLTEIMLPATYEKFEREARERLGSRDPDDWPILAAALSLECPIWTEDTDFFGCGVATWTSGRVERYLRQ